MVDDYILAVLREQSGTSADESPEIVQRMLEREPILGAEKNEMAGFMQDNAEKKQESRAFSQEEQKLEALENMLRETEPVETGWMRAQGRGINGVQGGTVQAFLPNVFSAHRAESVQTMPGAEAMSRFFQRDARRYS